MPYRFLKLVAVGLLSSCLAAPISPAPIIPAIGPLKTWPLERDGCACEFYSEKSGASAYLLSDIEGKSAWFNLGGVDVKLPLQKTTHQGRSWADGTKFERAYTYGDTPVKVSFDVADFRGEDFWLGGREVQGWPMSALITTASASALRLTGGCGC